jgi:hypothetical protein
MHQHLLGQEAHRIRNKYLLPFCKGKAIRSGQDDRPGGTKERFHVPNSLGSYTSDARRCVFLPPRA